MSDKSEDHNTVERDEHGFARANTFHEWCQINEDAIEQMMNGDVWEVMSKAWYGGYVEGGRFVGGLFKPS